MGLSLIHPPSFFSYRRLAEMYPKKRRDMVMNNENGEVKAG